MGYAAIGLAGVLAGLLFWQMRRAAQALDNEKAVIVELSKLQRLHDARGVAIENRDHMIDALTRERDRFELAVKHVSRQLQEQVTENVDTPQEIASSLRNALASIGMLQETDLSANRTVSGEIEAKL